MIKNVLFKNKILIDVENEIELSYREVKNYIYLIGIEIVLKIGKDKFSIKEIGLSNPHIKYDRDIERYRIETQLFIRDREDLLQIKIKDEIKEMFDKLIEETIDIIFNELIKNKNEYINLTKIMKDFENKLNDILKPYKVVL